MGCNTCEGYMHLHTFLSFYYRLICSNCCIYIHVHDHNCAVFMSMNLSTAFLCISAPEGAVVDVYSLDLASACYKIIIILYVQLIPVFTIITRGNRVYVHSRIT